MATKPTSSTRTTRTTRRVGATSQGSATWVSKKRSKSTRETYPDNWKEIRLVVLKRDNFCCTKCGIDKVRVKELGLRLEVDHIIRLADGGTNAFSNLVTLCSACHANRLNHRHMRIRK